MKSYLYDIKGWINTLLKSFVNSFNKTCRKNISLFFD